MRIVFDREQDLSFKKALYSRANEYFRQTGLSRYHNPAMLMKTIVMLSLYLLPFVAILALPLPYWLVLLLFILMGIGIAGIGMSVMHDANHYGYSGNPRISVLMGLSMNFIGADAYNWKIKHNKLHHVFTNIYGKDEDIESRAILRFAYASPLKKYHRYQHYYAWFFYSLMTLSIVFGDFHKRIRYRSKGITNQPLAVYRRSMAYLVVSKILYFFFIFALPLWLTSLAWWQLLIGFLLLHLTAGTILSLVFQLAHVTEGPQQFAPDKEGRIGLSLVALQLAATADFSKNNKWLSWYVGGLNYQIEHHLFPRICHVHYPALSKIVEATTREFNMPYHEHKGFGEAMASHIRTLKKLGREQRF